MQSQACCKKMPTIKTKLCEPTTTSNIFGINFSDPFSFGNCTSAPTPPVSILHSDGAYYPPKDYQQEQGNNPMRIETNSATAIVSAIKSDEAIQRDYLLDELRKLTDYTWKDTKFEVLRELFNMDAPIYPRTSQELIDAFTNGKVTIDQTKVDANTKFFAGVSDDGYYDDEGCGKSSRFYGITFTDLPVADRKGYEAATAAYAKAQQDTKRTIIVSSPADGLAALVALEAWMPTQNAPTTATVQ